MNTWQREAELAEVSSRSGLRLVVSQPGMADPGVRVLAWDRDELRPETLPLVRVRDAVAALESAPVGGGDDGLLLFTSGSTGRPKAVRLAQEGIVGTGRAVGERQGVRPGDRIFFPSPLFFVFGCSNALTNALTHRAALCTMERFEARAALALIERERCTVYYGVAPVTRALAACEDLPQRDISSLRTGTANATPEDLRLAIEVLGVSEVCNAYGMTEGYGHSTITDHTDPPDVRMTSQGQPLPTQEVRVVLADGRPAPAGTAGEIQLRGAVTPGYLDDPGLSGRAFTADGWFRTGDVGSFDGSGRLTFLARNHDMMKVKGINISPAEVELLLVGHPDVDEAFAFGVTTPEGDQEIGAVLVSRLDGPAREGLPEDVQVWARARAAAYKVPGRLWVRRAEELPLTATGKVSKKEMQDTLLSTQSTGMLTE